MDVTVTESETTYIIGFDAQGDVFAELAFEGFLILALQSTHILSDVLSKDMGTMNFGIEALVLGTVAGESFD